MKKIKMRKFRLRRWLFFRGLALLFFGLIVFAGSRVNVDAGMNDTFLLKNRKNGIYAVAEVNGESRIFYMNMYYADGILAYCIELGVDITSDRYNSTNDFSISYLSDEQIEYVRAITYFGYEYKYHNDYLYYAAAQEIIWEYISGVDVYWTSELDVNGERIDIDYYKNRILKLVDEYNKKISLDFESGQTYRSGDVIVIEDKNNILSDYEVVSSLYSDVSIEGNTLVIKIRNEVGRERIELRRKGYYSYDSMLYYYDNSQKLISAGNYRAVDEIISFDIEGITLNGKVEEGEVNGLRSNQDSLEGAIYELYNEDDNLIGQYISDVDGAFVVKGLKSGKYYFKQIKASNGYLVNDEITEVVVDRDNLEVSLKQQLITNDIVINKLYGSLGQYSQESGVIFEVYDDNIYFTEFITDDKGVANITLPFGIYKIVQKNTTNGYSKVDDFIVEVLEERDSEINYNLVNELILVNVKINTFNDEVSEVFKSDNIAYKIKKKGNDSYLKFEGSDTFYADSSGVVSIPIKLGFGNYILEQVDVPNGVLLYDKNINFSIDDNSKLELVDDELVMVVDVYNKLIKGNVRINALKEIYYKDFNEYGYKNEIRSNVEFILKANDDIIVNGKIKYNAGEDIYNGRTDDNGELIIDNLYLGNYCLIDNTTLEKQCFLIDSSDNKNSVVNIDLKFIEKLEKFSVIIKNESSSGKKISDSVFEIIDDDNDVIYTGITNDEGIIKMDDVLAGNYCIKQRSVSSDYYLLENSTCFLLDNDKTLELVNNKIINKTIAVPNTFQKNEIGFYEIIVITVMVGTGYVVYKKIFDSRF